MRLGTVGVSVIAFTNQVGLVRREDAVVLAKLPNPAKQQDSQGTSHVREESLAESLTNFSE